MFKAKVFLVNLTKKMWLKVTAYAVLAVVSALLAVLLRHRIPDDLAYTVSPETVGTILNILASSMLAVTTFSLTVMVQAYASATTSVTPRSTQLVIQDHTAQNVLATFLGTFLFSLVGIIALNAKVYQDKGRVVLFLTTIVVIVIMVVALIRWIDKLTRIGRVGETTKLVEDTAIKAMRTRASSPCLGCNRLDFPGVSDLGTVEIFPCDYGYVQIVDAEDLGKIADKEDVDIYVEAMPGVFVTPRTPLARVSAGLDAEAAEKIRRAFTVADERAFEQDPRFGVCVLAEIAQRELPPNTNDQGTVVDVLNRLVVVLAEYAEPKKDKVTCKRVWVPPLGVADLFDDAFDVISRSSAGLYQIQVRLHKCLRYLHQTDNDEFKENARRYARLTLRRSDASDLLETEKEELRRLALG